jgi:hypothetical protein
MEPVETLTPQADSASLKLLQNSYPSERHKLRGNIKSTDRKHFSFSN